MSALTKLFVVLLVVCALLLTAATTVFVNRTDDYRKLYQAASDESRLAKGDLAAMSLQRVAAEAKATEAINRINTEKAAHQKEIDSLTTRIGEKDRQISSLEQAKLSADATASVAAQNAKNVQITNDGLNKRVGELSDELNKIKLKESEYFTSITDLQKKLEAVEAERRSLAEQAKQKESEITRLNTIIAEANIPATSLPKPKKVSAPDVKGVIQKVIKSENGIYYAQISVGQIDRVEKGMKFTVVGKPSNPEFMGYLTVETVDQNSAYGRLDGPRVQKIAADDMVCTQL